MNKYLVIGRLENDENEWDIIEERDADSAERVFAEGFFVRNNYPPDSERLVYIDFVIEFTGEVLITFGSTFEASEFADVLVTEDDE